MAKKANKRKAKKKAVKTKAKTRKRAAPARRKKVKAKRAAPKKPARKVKAKAKAPKAPRRKDRIAAARGRHRAASDGDRTCGDADPAAAFAVPSSVPGDMPAASPDGKNGN